MPVLHPRLKNAQDTVRTFLSKYPMVEQMRTLCRQSSMRGYITGGVNRDAFLGGSPNDVDMLIEGCKDIPGLKRDLAGFGYGEPRAKGTFDLHFDLTCPGRGLKPRDFSIFLAQNTYGGVDKVNPTVKNVVEAYDFNINTFVVPLIDLTFRDPLDIVDSTFEKGLALLPLSLRTCVNNRARIILRGLKFKVKFPDLKEDDLLSRWMQLNVGHARRISVEDFNRILNGLTNKQRIRLIEEYESIRRLGHQYEDYQVKKILTKPEFFKVLREYIHGFKEIPVILDGKVLKFETLPFDYKQISDTFENYDTIYDTPNLALLKLGLSFRVRERNRTGEKTSVEVSLKSGKDFKGEGLLSRRDEFTKLSNEQRLELLDDKHPLEFSELGSVQSVLQVLKDHNIKPKDLVKMFDIRTIRTIVTFQSAPSSSRSNGFSSDLGSQIEIRFDQSSSNRETKYSLEFVSPDGSFTPELLNISKLFPGKSAEKTKLEMFYGKALMK